MSYKHVLEGLEAAGVKPTRNAVIDAMWGDTVPEPWSIENEMELPPDLRDFSWLDKEVEARPHPGAVVEDDHDQMEPE